MAIAHNDFLGLSNFSFLTVYVHIRLFYDYGKLIRNINLRRLGETNSMCRSQISAHLQVKPFKCIKLIL